MPQRRNPTYGGRSGSDAKRKRQRISVSDSSAADRPRSSIKDRGANGVMVACDPQVRCPSPQNVAGESADDRGATGLRREKRLRDDVAGLAPVTRLT
jgi:hypothetical protein